MDQDIVTLALAVELSEKCGLEHKKLVDKGEEAVVHEPLHLPAMKQRVWWLQKENDLVQKHQKKGI